MATVYDIEGGDHLTAAEFTLKGWNANAGSVTTGRVSGQAWAIAVNGSAMTKLLSTTATTMVVGIAFKANINPTSNLVLFALASSSGADIARVNFQTTTNKLFITNSGGTTIATGTTVLATGNWYYIELKIFINGASGTCELHLNGVSGEITTTTGNFGSTAIGGVVLKSQVTSTGFSSTFDDMYLASDFLGDQCVETLYPASDGTHQDWTPSTGTTHYNLVNEHPPDGDTSYVHDSTPGDRDTYDFTSLLTLVGSVAAVVVNLYARKDDAAARVIAPVIVQGGTTYDGSSVPALSTSYAFGRLLYNLDPTSSAWTIATVNANEYGVKEVS